MYDSIQTIRYMGNKNKLLDFIIPEIEEITTSRLNCMRFDEWYKAQ